MQGTLEHDDIARATASILGERDEKARAGAGVEMEKGRHQLPSPQPQAAPLVPGLPPPTLTLAS